MISSYVPISFKVHPYPVFIICPEPGFKPSIFEKFIPRVQQYFWNVEEEHKILENETSIPNVYLNMSYQYGIDWNLTLIHFTDKVKDENSIL